VLVETFIRKLLHLKAHYVTAVWQGPEEEVVEIDRFRSRMLRCGVCQGRCRKVHQVEEARSWRDLSLRQFPMVLCYRPRRVRCPRCGVRVEAVPWAQLWARVTTALARAVGELARHLSWQETARHFRLDWKSVASIVRRVVTYGLAHRRRRPLHVLGIDEVSRRKGHHYLTIVYDLERGALLWVGEDRTEETLIRFFTELDRRRSATLQIVCLDMWQAYLKAVRRHASNAQVLFDRLHLVQHLNRAVDEVRRSEMRRLSGREKTFFKRTRFLLLKNPWNLRTDERERLSTLVRWNSPIVRMLRTHLEGVLAWTRLRLSNGALEGMNNKIKLVSHRSFGFRTVRNYTAAIYHCCAHLPLPEES
jgi:transposase